MRLGKTLKMDQALLTAGIGFFLFAISEFSRGLFIGPILQLRELVGDVVDKVIYYSYDLTSGARISPKKEKAIREELRALATQLRAKEQMLPAYNIWSQFGLVPGSAHINVCAKVLVELSDSFNWDMGRIPPKYYTASYEGNISLIIELQKALRLKNQIVQPIEPDSF